MYIRMPRPQWFVTLRLMDAIRRAVAIDSAAIAQAEAFYSTITFSDFKDLQKVNLSYTSYPPLAQKVFMNADRFETFGESKDWRVRVGRIVTLDYVDDTGEVSIAWLHEEYHPQYTIRLLHRVAAMLESDTLVKFGLTDTDEVEGYAGLLIPDVIVKYTDSFRNTLGLPLKVEQFSEYM